MRSEEQINQVYSAFIDSMVNVGKEFLNQVKSGDTSSKEKLLFNEMTHVKAVFDESWPYLTQEEKDRHCDIAATYINN